MIRYKVGSEYYTEEEYKEKFGSLPNRMSTWQSNSQIKRNKFVPYNDPTIGYCVSYRDQEKKLEAFNRKQKNLPPEKRDTKHPEGLTFIQDHKKHYNQLKEWHKNGGDIRREQAKDPIVRERNERRSNNKRIFVSMG